MSVPEFVVGALDQESWNEWAERYQVKGGVEAATEKLGKLKHWKSFLEAISLETNLDEMLPIQGDLGAFTLIWYYGQLIRWAPSAADTEENANFTPWSERLRERKKDSSSKIFSEQTHTHPYATHLADYEERKDFPQVSDEIIVNAYLLGLASVVTFSIEGVEAHWTPERKGYKVCDEKGIKLYEARTDGHMYLNGNGKTKAIVEVKPVVRAELPRVMMQEVAQMAAWIHAEKDVIQDENLTEQWLVTPAASVFRRLLWSMNRHELYIIIAEYNGDYVDYLTNPRREAECESFMTMNQFGP
ncbi:hypothetical protein AtubIFM54640_001312 [Aspergillus tubingensis]|nr:hypothetical protein AtubIFM54640_001312 [Aspergillus tubingensis]